MMQRPVMNPMMMDDDSPEHRPGKPSLWRRAGKIVWRVGKILFMDVLRRKRPVLVNEVGTPFSRFVRGFLYRLLFVPTVLMVMVAILVVCATHPKPAPAVADPISQGVYYDPVELLSLDNVKLEAWLVPVVDARRVLIEKEDVLHKRYPAVVLVHDFGASRQQLLPLVAPLHEAGYVLLALNLRGSGPSKATGSTFGLNEAQDVRAAVEMLRRRSFIDPDAIGVLGVGTGGTAALLAAKQDPKLRVLVLDHPVRQFEDVLNERIGPRQSYLSWLRPMCKWAFELSYRVDAEEMDLRRFSKLMKERSVLLMDDPGESVSCIRPVRTGQVVDFLKKHLVAQNKSVTTLQQSQSLGSVELGRDSGWNERGRMEGGEAWPRQAPASEILQRAKGTGW